MESRKTLVKTKDILKKVSEEKGIPYSTVEVLYKIMINYCVEESKKDDVISIKFPFVGTMYVKKGFLLNKLEKIEKGRYGNKDNGLRTIKKLKNKIKYIDEVVKQRGYIHNIRRSVMNNYGFNKGASLQDREEKQNNYFYEGKN